MPNLRAFRPLPSCLLRYRTPPRRYIRHQHEEPHKYYFQDKNFIPPSPAPSFQPGPSRRTRFIRSSVWSLLGLTLGFVTLNSLATWSWLNLAHTPGDELDTAYLEVIQERLDNNPLSQLLAASPEWSVMQGLGPDGLDRCLRGSRGIVTRHWINPSKACMIVMIHFGEGTEGWPQQVHAGIIASYMHNAMTVMAPNCFYPPNPIESYDTSGWKELFDSGYYFPNKFEMNFKRVVSSGDVYCISITPALVFHRFLLTEMDSLEELRVIPKIEPEDIPRTLIGTIMQTDRFPYDLRHDPTGFIEFGNATGKFEQVVVVKPKKSVQLTMDGKIL